MRSWAMRLFVMTLGVTYGLGRMQLEYEWKAVDFVFPNQSMRDNYTNSGAFIYGNAMPNDVDVSPTDGRVFIALPNLFPGAAATLCTLSNQTQADGSPLLQPYPDWSWHRDGDCDGMTSVYRTHIDTCGRLWAIDTGMENYLSSSATQLCPPQLLVFDLATNTLIKRHRFPRTTLLAMYLLVTVLVDTSPESCEDAHAYVADIYGFGVYIYNLRKDKSWRVNGNLFYPYPRSGRFLVAGMEYYRMSGVIGLALGPLQRVGARRLYFQSLASDSLSWVHASVLMNESNFPNGGNLVQGEFHVYDGTRASQSTVLAMGSSGTLFFSLLSDNSVNCWNSRLRYGRENIVELDRDDEALQYVSSVKVVRPYNATEVVWVLSNRFHRIANDALNNSEVNFRVFKANVRDLVRGTNCQ